MNITKHSFPYVEPTIVSLLILSSFIYLLNVARSIADKLCYAGLIGQIFIGIVYAAPLANILKLEWQQTILDFGFIGLLLIVFEAGLETPFDILTVKSNLFLSSIIASTGVIAPIGLSMISCTYAFQLTLLESFSMGAALSVTSLGTTYAILSSQKQYQLNRSRMGTILVGAALLDDISGLVMASVIEKLQYLGKENLGWLILKPTILSISMMFISVLLARFILGRLWMKCNFKMYSIKQYADHLLIFILIATLSTSITIAAYTGASKLIGAYCCGAIFKYLDDCGEKFDDIENNTISFTHVFEKYIKIIKEYIFVPFFFASIGFAVPFVDLWHGKELWQGLVYSLMMILGKFISGIWILIWTCISPSSKRHNTNVSLTAPVEIPMIEQIIEPTRSSLPVKKSKGIYAALILGLSMVCRGEVGFLMANIALSTNILSATGFIITIWAILLNTIIAPIAVGLIVRFLGAKLNDGLWIN